VANSLVWVLDGKTDAKELKNRNQAINKRFTILLKCGSCERFKSDLSNPFRGFCELSGKHLRSVNDFCDVESGS
jgi:hypothetical protein